MGAEKTGYARLTLKQRLFVDFFVGEAQGNATLAARLAGYGTPEKSGYRVQHSAAVQAALDELLAAHGMPAAEVLVRLTEQGRGLYGEYIDDEGKVDLQGLRRDGLMRLVKKITRDRNNNVTVEFHDVQGALVQLARAHGLFRDRQEIEVRDVGAIASLDSKLAGLAAQIEAEGAAGELDGTGKAGAELPLGVLGAGESTAAAG